MTQYNPPQPQPWGPQPPAPKKRSVGKIAGLGCLGVLAFIVLIGIIGGIAGSGGSGTKSSGSDGAKAVPAVSASASSKPAASTPKASPKPKAVATPKKTAKPKPAPKPDVVVFKVWGTAPAGALGPLDINYGSDSDSRTGNFKNGTFTETLPLNDDAMYYNVSAQLQGSGDINCSVTVDGKTKKAHASGDYNICDAQLSGGLFGGWE